jgi:hypothetical protein
MILRFCLLSLLLSGQVATAQVITPTSMPQVLIGCTDSAVAEGFGVDAALYANSTFPDVDDWFTDSLGGAGIGIIGTGVTTAQPPLLLSVRDFRDSLVNAQTVAGTNLTYVQRMAVPSGSLLPDTSGGFRWMLDAVAARDNFGMDSSISVSANFRNNYNPLIDWRPGIGTISPTTDFVDVGAHVRRSFSSAGVPGDLWLYAFASHYDSGSNYVDVEVFRSSPSFNTTSNTVANSGSATTGGHTAAVFFNDATLERLGDMIFSANYTLSGDMSVRLWVNPLIMRRGFVAPTIADGFAAFNALPNRPFNFTGTFNSGPITNGFGYAEIVPINQTGCAAYLTTNRTSSVPGTPWGNYAYGNTAFLDNIGNHRLLEIAVNLSRFGIDQPTVSGNCSQVLGSLLFKSRIGLGFAGPTYDYVGPFSFAAFPEVNATAGEDVVVSCDSPIVVLNGSSTTPFATYQWYTFDGTIVSGDTTLTAVVDGPGMYYFQVSNPLLGVCDAVDSLEVKLATAPIVTATGDTLTSTPAASYQWYRNGVLISGATDQWYVAIQGGDYSVIIVDSLGCSAGSNVVTVVIAGIEEMSVLRFSLRPNPVSSHLVIDIKDKLTQPCKLSVFSAVGALQQEEMATSTNGIVLDVTKLPAGLYFLLLESDAKRAVHRFVKN